MNTSLSLLILALVTLALCDPSDGPSTWSSVIDLHEIVTGFGVPDPAQTQRYWLDSRTIVIDLAAFFTTQTTNDGFFPPDALWEFNLHADHAIGGINTCEYSLGYLALDDQVADVIADERFDNGFDTDLRLDGLADMLPRHVIKTGGFGEHRLGYGPQSDPWTFEKQNDGSFWQRSSSIVWLRGADPKLDRRMATHIYLHVDSCYLSRYVVQSQFERWNGQAYLMDWGNTPLEATWVDTENLLHVGGSATRTVVRWEAFDLSAASNDPNFLNKFNFLDRDSSIFEDSQGWWSEYFYFDMARFNIDNMANPVLDMWYYSGEDDIDEDIDIRELTTFALCVDTDAECTDTSNSYAEPFVGGSGFTGFAGNPAASAIWSASTSGQTTFVRSYVDLHDVRDAVSPTINDYYHSLEIKAGVKAAVPPYARLWDANSNVASRQGVSPSLMSIAGAQSAAIGTDCQTGGFNSVNDIPRILSSVNGRATTYYLLAGWETYRCNYGGSGQLEIGFSIPDYVANWPNPWMQWYEWGERGHLSEYGYQIVRGNANTKILHKSQYDHDPNPNSQQPYEFQVPFPQTEPRQEDWTVIPGQSIRVQLIAGTMDISAWVPVYAGSMNHCAGNPCDVADTDAKCYNWYRGMDVNGNAGAQKYYCMCSAGWMGNECQTSVSECHQGACLNGGICMDTPFDAAHHLMYTCDCSNTEYTGDFCERLANNCPVEPTEANGAMVGVCLNDGICMSGPDGTYTCDCSGVDFTGKFCEKPINDCKLDPMPGTNACGEHGDCVDTGTEGDQMYACDCEQGWSADPWCQTHDLCFGDNNPCMNGGMCVPVDEYTPAPGTRTPIMGLQDGIFDTARCMCAGSWFGETCEERFDEFRNDCRANRSGQTCAKGECKPVPGGNAGEPWACDCPDGYQGPWCEVATQCEGAANPCNTMDDAAQCMWMPTNPETPAPGEVDQRGIFGEHVCICSANWFGTMCDEELEDYFDDCRFWPNPCNGGACLPRERAGATVYECDCTNIPFDGEFCQNALACRGDPCGDNGECSVVMEADSTYTRHCQCYGGYMGVNCEFEVEDWITERFSEYTTDCRFSDLVCLNGGQCVANVNGGFGCVCQPPYTGPTCMVANVCEPNPCEAGGVCDVFDGAAVCLCPGGRAGDRCEQGIREFFKYDCRLSGCANGGLCSADTLTCNCPADWLQPTCETPAVCASNPCLNGGICQLGEGVDKRRFCLCPGDFFGPTCQWDVSLELADCRSQGCGDRGGCDNFNGNFVCICDAGWEGDMCEISPHCNPQPCKNGGRCYEYAQSFACHCSGDWSGVDCAISITARLEEVEERLEADVAGQVSNQVSTTVNDDLTVLQSEFDESEDAIEQLNEELKQLRQQLNAVGTSSKASQDAVDELKDGFCTIEEVDQLRTALELFLAPANNIVMSLSLLLALCVYFLN